MSDTENILIAVDGSPASAKAVAYVGRVLDGTNTCRVRLFHVLEPIGPLWVSLSGDLAAGPNVSPTGPEAHLAEEAHARSRPVLERMTGILTEAGVDPTRIDATWFVASREDSLILEILHTAREHGSTTIVVGRTALPWYRELFRSHLGERLVKKGEGFSLWVVE